MSTGAQGAAESVERDLLDRVEAGVRARLQALDRDQVLDLDPEAIARSMLDAMPTEHPHLGLGPFYDVAGLRRWLGVSRQAIHSRVRDRQLLACPVGEGQRVFPAWQFTPDGRVLPGFGRVLAALVPATDPWTAAVWLTTPTERLAGLSAVGWLTGRRPLPPLLDAAEADAARWGR